MDLLKIEDPSGISETVGITTENMLFLIHDASGLIEPTSSIVLYPMYSPKIVLSPELPTAWGILSNFFKCAKLSHLNFIQWDGGLTVLNTDNITTVRIIPDDVDDPMFFLVITDIGGVERNIAAFYSKEHALNILRRLV